MNTHGSYECRCHSGFELTASDGASGATCTDINECLEEGRCGHEGSCRYARSKKSKRNPKQPVYVAYVGAANIS